MIGIYIWIPFVGTFLGAACVLFMTGELKPLVQKSLCLLYTSDAADE